MSPQTTSALATRINRAKRGRRNSISEQLQAAQPVWNRLRDENSMRLEPFSQNGRRHIFLGPVLQGDLDRNDMFVVAGHRVALLTDLGVHVFFALKPHEPKANARAFEQWCLAGEIRGMWSRPVMLPKHLHILCPVQINPSRYASGVVASQDTTPA